MPCCVMPRPPSAAAAHLSCSSRWPTCGRPGSDCSETSGEPKVRAATQSSCSVQRAPSGATSWRQSGSRQSSWTGEQSVRPKRCSRPSRTASRASASSASTPRPGVHVEGGRWHQALEEAERHYALERPRGHLIWPRTHLRVLHVRALLGLSRREDALALADAEVELHARRGARGHEAMARLSKGYALEGDEAIAELRTAATCAAASPMRLAEAHVLAELGGRLRRAGRRTEARDPLRQAQDLARRAGATGLENHAREELIIAGARPQRVALAGVDSLTPSERRVANLATQGLSNREIAETLFVTLKTVEVHLGRAYAKLDIKGRAQLAAALGGE